MVGRSVVSSPFPSMASDCPSVSPPLLSLLSSCSSASSTSSALSSSLSLGEWLTLRFLVNFSTADLEGSVAFFEVTAGLEVAFTGFGASSLSAVGRAPCFLFRFFVMDFAVSTGPGMLPGD